MIKLSALGSESTFEASDRLVKVKAGAAGDRLVTMSDFKDALSPAWISWTPTLTNLSGGTLVYAKYLKIGKYVHFMFSYTLGGAGVSGNVRISLPVAAHASMYPAGGYNTIGAADLLDAGTINLLGVFALDQTTGSGVVFAINTAGTYSTVSGTTSTVPFTWAINDRIKAYGTYEAA